MKPVEQGFKNYWIKATNFPNLGMDGFRYSDCEISIDPNCVYNYEDFKDACHVVEIAALRAEQAKVAELVQALKDIYWVMCNHQGIEESELTNSIEHNYLELTEKYGASND